MSPKIIIPKEFDNFYYWYVEQKNKNPDSNFILGFEWDNSSELIEYMFCNESANRFGVFGSNGDGSLYAFWIDDQGQQKVVFISSDGGNELVLGNTFIEFLQYLSIGYSGPEITDFDLTFEQIAERDKVDYSQMTVESLNEYDEKYSKPLQTEAGIKELFGQDLDDEFLKMMLEINKNAAKQKPKIDAETVEKAKREMAERERIMNLQQKDFKEWLKTNFNVQLPKKGTEILNLEDKSFKQWVNRNVNS